MFARIYKAALLTLAALPACMSVRSDTVPQCPSRMDRLPHVTLWAWERPEDLSSADPARYAVAYLDQTLQIDLVVHAQSRRNPVIFPEAAARIPVVRIQTGPNALLNPVTRAETIQDILISARSPGIAALQVDFDATRSQREWYRELLVQLRQQMPSRLPLSITALASWCSYDDWLRGLPVDEAVPMFFRMEPDRRRAPADFNDFLIREPLCRDSAGVSTGEPWPSDLSGKRIYVFSDHGWRTDLTARLERRLR